MLSEFIINYKTWSFFLTICLSLQSYFASLFKQLLPLKALAFQNCDWYFIYVYVLMPYSIIKSAKTSGNNDIHCQDEI